MKRESAPPLSIKYVMFVPILKKNLNSVNFFEDCGYDMILNKGKEFLRHIFMGHVKHIAVCVKKQYKLDVEECTALRTKEEKGQSCDVSELSH